MFVIQDFVFLTGPYIFTTCMEFCSESINFLNSICLLLNVKYRRKLSKINC